MTDALAARIADAAAEAGALALDRRRSGAIRIWEKSPGHPVCDADIEIDALLRDRLRAIDPDAGWLSEETLDHPDRLFGHRVWVVDPIDGTRDYIRGRDGWAVSIALVEGGRPLVGVLDAPARSERWLAIDRQGATRNGQPLTASDRDRFAGARVPADQLPRVDRDLVAVAKPNSIALRIGMVAAAEADLVATISWGHEWDIAAAALIATEAGARVTDAHGRELIFNSTRGGAFGVIAAAPAIHADAVERLKDRVAAARG